MSWTSKILPFKRPLHDAVAQVLRVEADAFPRFRKEWDRPAAFPMGAVAGFAIPPTKAK